MVLTFFDNIRQGDDSSHTYIVIKTQDKGDKTRLAPELISLIFLFSFDRRDQHFMTIHTIPDKVFSINKNFVI